MLSGDNGSLFFWDWRSGYNFQRMQTTVQPGSMDSEAGIFAAKFDKSGSRLFTCEADKTIKVYKEDETAVWRLNLQPVYLMSWQTGNLVILFFRLKKLIRSTGDLILCERSVIRMPAL